MKPNPFVKALAAWLAMAFVLSVAAGISYFTMQQGLRQSANWPQAQMAADAAAAVAAGRDAGSLVSGEKVDIATGQMPFLVVYDASGNPVAYSGTWKGSAPKLPQGVLDYAQQNGEDRVTWQPAPGVRIAAVVVKVQGGQGGAVLAGRSLKESERATFNIGRLVAAAWAGSLAFLLVICLLAGLVAKNRKPNKQ